MTTGARPGPDDDAARVSRVSRVAGDDEDATRLSARVADDEDVTQLATRATEEDKAVQPHRRRGLSPLPPGVKHRPTVQAGTFGQAEPAYGPRAAHSLPSGRDGAAQDEHADSRATQVPRNQTGGEEGLMRASAVIAEHVLSPEQSARRRELARRKRIAVVLVVACVAAAALAGAAVGIVVLWSGDW